DAAAADSRPSPSIGSFCCWKAHIQCGVVCRAIPSIFMELNFFVVGKRMRNFDKGKDPISFNLVDPVQRNYHECPHRKMDTRSGSEPIIQMNLIPFRVVIIEDFHIFSSLL
ncbi:unnamed protein product, partial [Linum tenue]